MTDFTTFGTANTGTRYTAMGRNLAKSIEPVTDGTEAMRAAGIDWQVCEMKLADIYESSMLPCPGNAGDISILTRSDNGMIVGNNGKRYNVVQNDVLAELGDAIIQVRPDARYVAGGDLKGGKLTFLMLELAEGIDLGGGDAVNRHILLYKGHDGAPIVGMGVNQRPFCTNQWTSLTAGKPRIVSIRHTASADDRIKQASHILQAAFTQFDEWDQALRKLVAVPARLSDYKTQICGDRPDEDGRAMIGWEKRVNDLFAEYGEDFNSNLVGTAAGVVMAAQGADEHRGRCSKSRDEQRVTRLLTGGYPMGQRAMEAFATV